MLTELLSWRRKIATFYYFADFGVQRISLVTIRITEMHARYRCMVQIVAGNIIAQLVAAVIGKPQFVCIGMPGKPYLVADAFCTHFQPRTIGIDAGDAGKRRPPVTDIARRAHWHIEQAIWPKAHELPTMMAIFRELIVHHHRLRRTVETALDIIETYHPVHFGDVQGAIPKRYAIGRIQASRKLDHVIGLEIAISIDNSVDVAR